MINTQLDLLSFYFTLFGFPTVFVTELLIPVSGVSLSKFKTASSEEDSVKLKAVVRSLLKSLAVGLPNLEAETVDLKLLNCVTENLESNICHLCLS